MEYSNDGTVFQLFPTNSLSPSRPSHWKTYSTTVLHQTQVLVVPDTNRSRDRAFVFLGGHTETVPGACDSATSCYATLLGAVRHKINETSLQYPLPQAGPAQTAGDKYLFSNWILVGVLRVGPAGNVYYATGRSNTMNLYRIDTSAEQPVSCSVDTNICPSSGGVVSKLSRVDGNANVFISKIAFADTEDHIIYTFLATTWNLMEPSGVRHNMNPPFSCMHYTNLKFTFSIFLSL